MSTSTQQRGQGDRGRDAASPHEIPARGWWDIVKRTFEGFGRNRMLLVAAGVTFYALLALVPAMAAFITLYGLFFDPQQVNEQVARLSGIVPDNALEIIRDQATRIASQGGKTLGITFVLTFAFSLWSANAGLKAMIDALNVAYGEHEKRSFIALNAQSLLLTVGGIACLIAIIAALAVVPIVLRFVGFESLAGWLVSIARWPLLLALVVGALAVLYRYGPSRERARWQWISWGSAVAALAWLMFSGLFSWYVGNFGNYNETYGSLGAVIVFMTWMWLSATIVLAGAELNAEIEHQTTRDTTVGDERPIGKRGASMADSVGEAPS